MPERNPALKLYESSRTGDLRDEAFRFWVKMVRSSEKSIFPPKHLILRSVYGVFWLGVILPKMAVGGVLAFRSDGG
jgi:hypothetical protein